jgi:hypothetical protein
MRPERSVKMSALINRKIPKKTAVALHLVIPGPDAQNQKVTILPIISQSVVVGRVLFTTDYTLACSRGRSVSQVRNLDMEKCSGCQESNIFSRKAL